MLIVWRSVLIDAPPIAMMVCLTAYLPGTYTARASSSLAISVLH